MGCHVGLWIGKITIQTSNKEYELWLGFSYIVQIGYPFGININTFFVYHTIDYIKIKA